MYLIKQGSMKLLYTNQMSSEGLALRDIKVFLSSTFQDMEEERNYLAKYTFPRIVDYCMRRHIIFSPIDLRWGITNEENVLQVCFEEIERAAPFFIGLVGARYGWTPSRGEYQNALSRDSIQMPWLKEAIAEEKSITEMEFLFGALKREEKRNAVFYIKDKVVREPRQEELKLVLEKQTRFVTKPYSTVKNLGDLVYADMIKLIEEVFPINQSEISYKSQSHEFKLAQRLNRYVHFENKVREELQRWYNGSARFCAIFENVTITNGVSYYSSPGKSMHLCSFVDSIRQSGHSAIYYDTQAINECADDFIDDLSEYIESGIGDASSTEDVLMAIDNLDCLISDEIEDRLVELLKGLPARVRVLLSTRHTAWTMKLPFEYVKCTEPTVEHKGVIIDKYLSMFGKKITPQDKAVMVSSRRTMNEIGLMLEALLRFGSYDRLSKEIDEYSNGSLELRIIHDIKSDIGNMKDGSWEAMWILNAIALSGEAGLSEKEIIGMSSITPLRWAAIRKRVLELCTRQGAYYIINNLATVRQELLNAYYANFRDMIIDRMKLYISKNGMSPLRLGIVLPSLYSNYFGVIDADNAAEKHRLEKPTIYQDIELVNNMSIYKLVAGWSWKYLGLEVNDMPGKWALRKKDIEYTDADLIKYYSRLKFVTHVLRKWEDCKKCIKKLYELTGNEHDFLLNRISFLCSTGDVDAAQELYSRQNLEGERLIEATVVLARGAFDVSRIDVVSALIETLDSFEVLAKKDSELFYEAKMLLLEWKIADIYVCGNSQEIKTRMREENILGEMDICLKALYYKGKKHRLLSKLVQLIGYANMMSGNYDSGIRSWMDSYVQCTNNVYTAYSMEYQQALLEYGLCFLCVGKAKLANEHIGSSEILSYLPEQIRNPWLINTLELLVKMDGVKTEYKRKSQSLLEIIAVPS